MNDPKPEPFAPKGAWTPFMCPSCRGLFRVKKDAEGVTQCPLCDSKVLISRPESAPADSDHTSEKQPAPEVRRRKVSNAPAKEHKWEQTETSGPPPQKSYKGILFTFFFLLAALVGAGIFFVFKGDLNKNNEDSENTKFSDKNFNLNDSGFDGTESFSKEDESILQIETNDFETAKSAASKFLSCENLEDLAPLIREPERTMPMIREYYKDTPYKPPGIIQVNEAAVSQVAKKFTSFAVILKDYSTKPIAVEITDKGPLVDWESWIGFCEIPWQTFIEQKVKEPTLVRVKIQRDHYFNFNFKDESKWISYRLTRDADDPVITGYLPSGSPLTKSLSSLGNQGKTVMIKIRFPDDIATDDQVLITDFVQEGWVIGL